MSKISPSTASRLHRNFMNHASPSSSTRASIITYPVLINILKEIFDKKARESFEDFLNNSSIACYFGRYDSSDGSSIRDKNTVIVHVLNWDATINQWVAEPDEIHDFGDMRPPIHIVGEQIIYP